MSPSLVTDQDARPPRAAPAVAGLLKTLGQLQRQQLSRAKLHQRRDWHRRLIVCGLRESLRSYSRSPEEVICWLTSAWPEEAGPNINHIQPRFRPYDISTTSGRPWIEPWLTMVATPGVHTTILELPLAARAIGRLLGVSGAVSVMLVRRSALYYSQQVDVGALLAAARAELPSTPRVESLPPADSEPRRRSVATTEELAHVRELTELSDSSNE